MRCFTSFERDFADDEFYCGQFNKHVVTNLIELPEKERFKFCDTFYPFSNQYVPIDERDRCYEYFSIEIRTSENYDDCHDKLEDLDEFESCLLLVGSKPKADACWMAS